MPYQYNIPLAADRLSQSQADINGNFLVLGALGGIPGVNNSSGINLVPGAGFNYVFFTAGGNPPTATFGTSNAFYSSLFNYGGGTPQNEVFVNKQNQVTQVQIPFTASSLSTVSAPAINASGWNLSPSGILTKWGYKTNAGPLWIEGNNTVTYPVGGGIPAFAGIPSNVQVTLSKVGAAALNATISANLDANNTTFTLNIARINAAVAVNLGGVAIYWMVTGRGV
jgi:hypothetical protein